MIWKFGFWKKRVYADAAAATPVSRRARRELWRLLSVYGNAGALHNEGIEAKKELERARAMIAASIGAHADEIIFTASGTEGNNLAIQGILRRSDLRGKHAITIAIEHQSVLEPLRALKREGLEVTEVGVDTTGAVFPNAILDAVRPDTAFVSVQLVNSEVGTIEPVREVAKGLRRAGRKIFFHTDASQAPLWLDLNVEKLGVDLMTLDAQKVLGPKGVGILYIRRGTPVEPLLWGGKQEQGLRGGTENVPAAGSFAVALRDAQNSVKKNVRRVSAVRDYLWSEIVRLVPDAVRNGPPSGESLVANNLNISVPGLEAEMAVISMDALGVAVSTRSACTIGSDEPSHVIKALGIPRELAGTAIRITLLPGATKGDARRIAEALFETAGRYRRL
ncbi:MAG: cysteine desulfurase family protein [Patescibacteria group bacterium]